VVLFICPIFRERQSNAIYHLLEKKVMPWLFYLHIKDVRAVLLLCTFHHSYFRFPKYLNLPELVIEKIFEVSEMYRYRMSCV